MTKLALSDEILMKIDKPARYIGNELNSIKKDKNKVDIRFAMCFPDVYEIGSPIWVSRFCMTCLTSGRMSGASASIRRGRICTPL